MIWLGCQKRHRISIVMHAFTMVKRQGPLEATPFKDHGTSQGNGHDGGAHFKRPGAAGEDVMCHAHAYAYVHSCGPVIAVLLQR